jgi:hypothetical protein
MLLEISSLHSNSLCSYVAINMFATIHALWLQSLT